MNAEDNRVKIALASGIQQIVSSMLSFSGSEKIQKMAIKCLCNVALNNRMQLVSFISLTLHDS